MIKYFFFENHDFISTNTLFFFRDEVADDRSFTQEYKLYQWENVSIRMISIIISFYNWISHHCVYHHLQIISDLWLKWTRNPEYLKDDMRVVYEILDLKGFFLKYKEDNFQG